MRILHGPSNVAGAAGLIARGQRAIGHDAVAICHPSPDFAFSADLVFARGSAAGSSSFSHTLVHELPRADVLHVYFGQSFLGPGLADARLARLFGKPVFHTFLGCDLRDVSLRLSTETWSVCRDCRPRACAPNRATALKAARESKSPVLVTTPDLLDEAPEAVWLPLPVDAAAWSGARKSTGAGLRIFHAPTDELKKGTAYLRDAVGRWRDRGADVELVVAEPRTPQARLRDLALGCDLAVDQIVSGVYGTFGAEMMAAGLPTVAWISDRRRARYPEDLPLLSASPEEIEGLIGRVLDGAVDLNDVGAKSAAYAWRVHDHVAVAKRIETLY